MEIDESSGNSQGGDSVSRYVFDLYHISIKNLPNCDDCGV